MFFKIIKPTTSSLRHTKLVNKHFLKKKNSSLKKFTQSQKNSGGRNNQGVITAFQKGGGSSHNYRSIDFNRNYSDGIIEFFEYDPNRTCYLARLYKSPNLHYYILAPTNVSQGSYLQSGKSIPFNIGNCLPIDQIPIGFLIHNISSTYIRSAGTYGQLLQKTKTHARIKFPSGEQRLILTSTLATLGSLSNNNHRFTHLGKAGRSRWLNKRPNVRGVAMNPIDHPHGGGEGKTSGGRPSVTPWGKPARGQSTSNHKLKRSYILIPSKHKQKKKKK